MKKEIIKKITLAGICICAALSQTIGTERNVVYTISGNALSVEEARTELEVRELLHRAKAGEAEAQYELSICYGRGNGVKQDYEDYAQGREWFLKAAEQGDPGGMLGLGELYLKGLGVTRDLQKARKYLEAAAASGEEIPEELLKELRSIDTAP